MMTLYDMIRTLKSTTTRRLEGENLISGVLYHVKAYKIGPPHSIMRIDLKVLSEEEMNKCKK